MAKQAIDGDMICIHDIPSARYFVQIKRGGESFFSPFVRFIEVEYIPKNMPVYKHKRGVFSFGNPIGEELPIDDMSKTSHKITEIVSPFCKHKVYQIFSYDSVAEELSIDGMQTLGDEMSEIVLSGLT